MSHSGQVGHEDMQLVTSENSGLHDTDGKREGRNEIPLNHIQRSQQGNPPFCFSCLL